MIPKAVIHAVAKEESLRDTTVEKDYVLGWMLHGIAAHPSLSRWVFKGGTCLKKCFIHDVSVAPQPFAARWAVEL
ncbi:MAG: hypothetical protein RL701_3150 [Pseudomonadota bacterium]|jgi:predicted nucleotidyltransferase component of viral defense system